MSNYYFSLLSLGNTSDYVLLQVLIPAIISAIISLIVCAYTVMHNKKSFLYEQKYNFFVKFTQLYFNFEPYLELLIKQAFQSQDSIVLINKNAENVLNQYKQYIIKWEEIYKLMYENDKVFLEQENIYMLAVSSFMQALSNTINNNKFIITKEKENVSSISKDIYREILSEAKNIFLTNMKKDSPLKEQFLSEYEKQAKEFLDLKIDEDVIKIIVDDELNKTYIQLLTNNHKDIVKKLKKITNAKGWYDNFSCFINKKIIDLKTRKFNKYIKGCNKN